MKFLIAFSILIFGVFGAQAETDSKPGYAMKIDFKYESPTRNFQSKTDIIFSTVNKGWTPLMPAIDGLALLGQVDELDDDVMTLNYMIVDTKKSPVAVINMGVVTLLGTESSITTKMGDEKITVLNTVSESTYTETK